MNTWISLISTIIDNISLGYPKFSKRFEVNKIVHCVEKWTFKSVAGKNFFEGKIVPPKDAVRKLLHEYLYEILGEAFATDCRYFRIRFTNNSDTVRFHTVDKNISNPRNPLRSTRSLVFSRLYKITRLF